jgi:hypothetical protein
MVHRKLILPLILFATVQAIGQSIAQNIRGVVLDKDSKAPLEFALLTVSGSEARLFANTDSLGNFILKDVPVGRQSIKIRLLGYKTAFISDLLINAAKEVILTIELEQEIMALDTIVLNLENTSDGTVNEMVGISGRTFSTVEANRFAGSQNDPARMARNFAGVSGASDQRNDIIIRGNAPQGLLWRIEGIPVPNPNHFSGQGSTGGPISILNYKMLSNSDFLNATSGVFDIGIRNGNNQRSERTLQLGALGVEALLEGPFSKTKKSSYLVGYRYSTLSILANAGVKLGFASVPYYQDLSFKFNFITKKVGEFKLFGVGGKSNTVFLDSKRDSTQFSPANKGENVSFGSKTGILGLSHQYFFNNSTFIKSTIATTYEENGGKRDSIQADKSLKRTGGFGYNNYKFVLSSYLNKKINAQHTVQIGGVLEQINYTTKDSLLFYKPVTGTTFWGFNNDFSGSTALVQAYAQWKYKINNQFTLNTGLHSQYFALNKQAALEPRVALNYKLTNRQKVSIGYGLHNQLQPYGMYFYTNKNSSGSNPATNKNLRFSRSNQFIASYDLTLNSDFRIKVETYFQQLNHVPVEKISSSYSVLNYGATFNNTYKENLTNKGLGQNYGLELTVEKFFSHGYYFLWTTSLYQSTYKGSDNVWRNTAFNGNYVVNALGGYEIKLKNNYTFLIDAKLTLAGGLRYTAIDITSSIENNEATYKTDEAFEQQNKTYFKPDIKFTVRKDFKKRIALEWALDIQNVINYQNIYLNWFDKNVQKEFPVYQNGRFPTVQLKLEF